MSHPQEPGDETQHLPKQKRILQELIALQKLDQLNPLNNQESPDQFLFNFDWKDSTFDKKACQVILEKIGELYDIFARQRFDNGIQNDFKV